MILDNLSHAALYYGVHKNMKAAFDFIKKAMGEDLPVGKYELDGKNLFAMVQAYDSKPAEGTLFEGHKNYIDLQFVWQGREVIEVIDVTRTEERTAYNPDKDKVMLAATAPATPAYLTDGDFAIVFPHDIHNPGLAPDGKVAPVKKIVVKIKM